MNSAREPVELPLGAEPPPGYVPVCIGFECGSKLDDGRKSRHFCKRCWGLVPRHLQEALRGELAWLEAHGRSLNDRASVMVVGACAARVFQARLDEEPALRAKWEADQRAAQEAPQTPAEERRVILPGE